MKRNLTKVVGGILLGVVLLAALAACGGSMNASEPLPTATQTTATTTPTATVALAPTASPTGPSSSDLLAQGKLIFEKTAGGVGCASCHGLDGKGKSAPYNRGASETRFREVLAGSAMNFIKLTDEEIKAVVAYLQWLSTQP